MAYYYVACKLVIMILVHNLNVADVTRPQVCQFSCDSQMTATPSLLNRPRLFPHEIYRVFVMTLWLQYVEI